MSHIIEKIYNSDLSVDEKKKMSAVVLALQSSRTDHLQQYARIQERVTSLKPDDPNIQYWISYMKEIYDNHLKDTQMLLDIERDPKSALSIYE